MAAAPAGPLVVRMFGPLQLRVNGSGLGPRDLGGVKPKQLLEVLLERGRPVAKDRIAELLWGEAPPQRVAATIETYVSVLRRRLDRPPGRGRRLLLTERAGYRLATDELTVDVDRYDDLLRAAAAVEPTGRRAALEQAAALGEAELVADELGVPPGPETARLHTAILRGEAATALLPHAAVASTGAAAWPRPEVRYARNGTVRIASQVVGQGPVDLVFSPSNVSSLAATWEDPTYASFLDRWPRSGGWSCSTSGAPGCPIPRSTSPPPRNAAKTWSRSWMRPARAGPCCSGSAAAVPCASSSPPTIPTVSLA